MDSEDERRLSREELVEIVVKRLQQLDATLPHSEVVGIVDRMGPPPFEPTALQDLLKELLERWSRSDGANGLFATLRNQEQGKVAGELDKELQQMKIAVQAAERNLSQEDAAKPREGEDLVAEKLLTSFRIFDRKETGVLNRESIARIMRKGGNVFTDKQVEEMLKGVPSTSAGFKYEHIVKYFLEPKVLEKDRMIAKMGQDTQETLPTTEQRQELEEQTCLQGLEKQLESAEQRAQATLLLVMKVWDKLHALETQLETPEKPEKPEEMKKFKVVSASCASSSDSKEKISKRCIFVCKEAKNACGGACVCHDGAESSDADAEDVESVASVDASETGEPVGQVGEAKGPQEDFVETEGFQPETVVDLPETYPLQYAICGQGLFPQDPNCGCKGNYQGTETRIIPPKTCPTCEGEKICKACDGAGLKAKKVDCKVCIGGKCPTCKGHKTVKCKGCDQGHLKRPRACDLCGGRGQMMVWDGSMAFFFNQTPGWDEWIKFRGLTIEPKKWGNIAGKCSSGHGCFAGLNNAFHGDYKEDPSGQYPLGIMEIVVDTRKTCSNGTRYVKFLGKLKKQSDGTLKWCKEGSRYGDDARSGYFKGGWIELFQSWAPCEMCKNSKTPGYIGEEEVECPKCVKGKRSCPACKKLPGKCMKCKGKGKVPGTQDCKACDDGNCPACAGEGQTAPKEIQVPGTCPLCNNSGMTGAKHALLPKLDRLFIRRKWIPPEKYKNHIFFSEKESWFAVEHYDLKDSFMGHSVVNALEEGKEVRFKITVETVTEYIDMGRGQKISYETQKFWCEAPGVFGASKCDGKYFHNPGRKVCKIYFGPEDQLGEPVIWHNEILDVEPKEEDPVTQCSAERGFLWQPVGLWAFGFTQQITYIDVGSTLETHLTVRRVCELRMDFEGCIYLGCGSFKLTDLPVHPSKLRSVWTGWSSKGHGNITCLLFEGYESEDCSGEPLTLKTLHRSSDPKGETNQFGDHWLWDQKIKSFKIFPKEGCDIVNHWGPEVPRWPLPLTMTDFPEAWNLDASVWSLLYGCTQKRIEFIDAEGEPDFKFESWQERFRKQWKNEACHLYSMTVDYRMIEPPPPPPPPPPKPMPDFNGKWLVKYKAYFGVKEHIQVKDNKFNHKKLRYTINTDKGTFALGDRSLQVMMKEESTADFIQWVQPSHPQMGYITWTREG